MSATIEKLKTELTQLSVGDRAHVADFLLQSLEGEPEAGAEALWDAELARRVEEIDNGTDPGIPAEEVHAAARKRLREARHL